MWGAFVPTMKSLDSDKKPSGIPKTKDAVVEEKIDFSKVKVEPLFEEYVCLLYTSPSPRD